jgi:signal peptidase I
MEDSMDTTPSTINLGTQRPRHALWAVLLSVAATGLGHIYCGRLLKGLVLFFASFAFAPIIVIAAQNAASPLMLALVIIALLFLLGIFIYALVDAGFLARRLGNNYQLKEYNRWYVYLLFIVVAISYPTNLASSIRDDILQAFKIPSQSMAPNILPGDRVLLNKARYKIAPVQRGDVVVFVYPDDRRRYYLKRIVGLPGDSVEIRDNMVYVNDRPLVQDPVKNKPTLNFSLPAQARMVVEENGHQGYPVIIDPDHPTRMARMVVPHGQCFVLADNRPLTTQDEGRFGDSREFGPVPLADIKGRVAAVYWPALNWLRFGRFQN